MEQQPQRRLYELDEALRLLGGIGRTKFLEEVGAGRLKAVNIGRRRLFAVEDIDEYVQLLRAERAEAQRGRD